MRWVFVVWFVISASAVGADGLGIRFEDMPKGLEIHYQGSQNREWVDVYLGQQGGSYILERHLGSPYGPVSMTRYFNADGHEVERQEQDRTQHFKPQNCARILGDCVMKVDDSRLGAFTVISHVAQSGNEILQRFETSLKPGQQRAQLRLGPYNLPDWQRSNDYLMILTQMVEPAMGAMMVPQR